jgi:hypothetical protein
LLKIIIEFRKLGDSVPFLMCLVEMERAKRFPKMNILYRRGSNLLEKTVQICSLWSTPSPSSSSFSLLIITSAHPSAPPAAPLVCPLSSLRPATAPPLSAYPTSRTARSLCRPGLAPGRRLTSCAAPWSSRGLAPCSSPVKLTPTLDSWSDSYNRSSMAHPSRR